MTDSFIAKQGFGSLVANAFRIYVKNARTLIGLSAVVLLPGLALVDVLGFRAPESGIVDFFSFFLTFFLQVTVELFLVGEVSQACFGQRTSFRRSLSRASGRGWGRLLGTNFLALAVVAVAAVAVIFVGQLLQGFGVPYADVAGVAIALAVAATLWVRYTFVTEIAILERMYGWRALRASSSLVAGSFWKTLFYGVAFWAAVLLSSAVVGGAGGAVLGLAGASDTGFAVALVIVSDVLTVLVVAPVWACFWTLFYYSHRIESDRLTGADLVEIQSYGNL